MEIKDAALVSIMREARRLRRSVDWANEPEYKPLQRRTTQELCDWLEWVEATAKAGLRAV